jgi:hypothetical protein
MKLKINKIFIKGPRKKIRNKKINIRVKISTINMSNL